MPPPSLILELFLKVILPSLAVSAAVVLLLGRTRCSTVTAALALVAGVAVGNWFREALPWLPDQAAWQWLPAAVLAALAAGLLVRLPRMPTPVGWLLRAGVAGLVAWLLVPPDLYHRNSLLDPLLMVACVAVFAAAVLANWIILEWSADSSPGGTVAAGLAGAFVGGAAIMIHAHSARLADVAFLFGFSLAGIGLAAWWQRTSTAAAMSGAAVFLPGLLLAGYSETFSDLPWLCFALVALAPLALTPLLWQPVARLAGRLWLVQLGLLLLPVIVAVGLAMHAEPLEFE